MRLSKGGIHYLSGSFCHVRDHLVRFPDPLVKLRSLTWDCPVLDKMRMGWLDNIG